MRLLTVIAAHAAGLPFHARHVMHRARLIPALAEALRDADIVSARQLGKWLARCEGAVVNGVRLDRGRLTDGAFYWQLVQVSEV